MSETTQIATILGVLKERGTIQDWRFPTYGMVEITANGVRLSMTYLVFWSQHVKTLEASLKLRAEATRSVRGGW